MFTALSITHQAFIPYGLSCVGTPRGAFPSGFVAWRNATGGVPLPYILICNTANTTDATKAIRRVIQQMLGIT